MQTLLIVDEEKLIRQGIRAIVRHCGVQVDSILECGSGEQALEILKMQKVDVMFTDIRMPGMDGIALVKAVQELSEKPLIVVISAYVDFSYAVKLMRMGVREYLLKPVDREKIKETLELLDSEIEAGKENDRQDRSVGCQQLKYAILNNRLTDSEKEVLIKQYGSSFFGGDYRVLCTNNTGGMSSAEAEMPYIYLSNVEEKELYIVEEGYVPILLREELGGRFVGASEVHRRIENLRNACEESFAARKEAFYTNRPVVYFGETVDARPKKFTLNETVITRIVQLLGTDKYEEAMGQLTRIFKNASLGGYEPAAMERAVKLLLDGIQSTYASAVMAEDAGIAGYYEIYGYPNMEEYGAEVMSWFTDFCHRLNSRLENDRSKQKIQKAVAYIRENYHKDLNMAVVSNHISMNYSLFSNEFKQYTGSNFVNYLKEIRIEEAKKLLENTDMKVVDISLNVGY